jgi:hypothetical protein
VAITRVQASGKQTGDNITTDNVTLNGVATGNSLFCLVSGFQVGAGVNVSSDISGAFTQDARASNGNPSATVFAIHNVASGNHVVTVDCTAAGKFISWSVTEVHSDVGALALDKTKTATGSSTSPSTGATATTTHTDEILMACFAQNSTQASITVEVTSPTWTEEYEELNQSLHQVGEGDSKIVSGLAAYTASWTDTNSSAWAAAMATYFEQAPSNIAVIQEAHRRRRAT